MKRLLFVFLLASLAGNAYFAWRCNPFRGKAETAPAEAEDETKLGPADRVVKFLKDSKVFYIATVDGKGAQVRPFGVALNIDGKVSVCTGAWKNVAKQILANPNVAISAMRADGKYIRITGRLSDNSTETNRVRFMKAAPELESLYKGKEDEFRVLSFLGAYVTIEDTAGHREAFELK
ncbi:MAG: pyridoxamine 5'-phosphate oxidase family protein [Rickettsiales bacterium]|nr:pyridoxamine 5'-phosphate oxidase family protein [Rickettsiales bacterium]